MNSPSPFDVDEANAVTRIRIVRLMRSRAHQAELMAQVASHAVEIDETMAELVEGGMSRAAVGRAVGMSRAAVADRLHRRERRNAESQ